MTEETALADAGPDSPLNLDQFYARPQPVRMRTYALGRYTVHVAPLSGAHHMAAYRVYLGAKLLGRRITPPSLADCKVMERPPEVPPAKFIVYNGARGRPRKDARPREHPGGIGPKPWWWGE